MLSNIHIGEFTALLTAVCWTITAIAFESASKRVGSVVVNLIRIVLAFIFLAIFNFIRHGYPFPINADFNIWGWLLLSGLIGFVLGDFFLFESYVIVGARIAALIMTTVPLITTFIGWLLMHETMTSMHFVGMLITISGIILVLFKRNGNGNRLGTQHSLRGILFAFLGAVGQAIGLVLSKYGMGDYDPFMATQIRTMAGIFGFGIIVVVMKRWTKVEDTLTNKPAIIRILFGSFFGPFLGVSLSLFAVQHTNTGIASTIMALVPVLIIPPSIIFMKQKITTREIIGAVISVLGVSLFFI